MSKPIIRTYSRYAQDARHLLGKLIRIKRKQSKLKVQDVAERAGISRGLMQRIEKGEPECAIGVVFEVASIVGVKLFDAEQTTLTQQLNQQEEKLALLPISVRSGKKEVDDDF